MTKQLAIPQAPVQPIEVGKKQTIQLSKGQHASVQDLVGGSAKNASNVVATKKGSDLNVKFADGTELHVPNYYTECAGNACSILVDGEKGGYLISADGAAGAAAADGSQLVYAYGEQSSLMAMAGADAGVSSALSGLGAGTVSYVPGASAAAGALGAGAGLSAGALAGVVAGGVALAAAGGGGGGSTPGGSTPGGSTPGGGTPADTTPPAAGTLSLVDYIDTGVSDSDRIGTDNTFDLSLSGQEAGATVVYQVSRDGGTTWSDTPAAQASLRNGEYQFRAIVTDAAGNTAASPAVSVTVDAPVVIGQNPGTSPLTYDRGNGDRNGDGQTDADDFVDNDDLFDDPLTFTNTDASTEVLIGDRVRGLTVVSNFVPGETSIPVPDTLVEYGDDVVHDAQFEVYYGTYENGIFTVTSTSETTADPRTATHTMILYDNDPSIRVDGEDQVQFLDGVVLTGVYAEYQWQIIDEGTPDARLHYRPNECDYDFEYENVLYGTAGADALYGEDGIDIIYGGDESDELSGGAGEDVLIGGTARDVLVGGDDLDRFDDEVDRFVFNGVADSNWDAGYDYVLVSIGDVFDFLENVDVVVPNGGPATLIERATLSDMNTLFAARSDGIANVEAMLMEFADSNSPGNFTSWVVVDVDGNGQITTDDYVIEVYPLADDHYLAGLNLVGGNLEIMVEPLQS